MIRLIVEVHTTDDGELATLVVTEPCGIKELDTKAKAGDAEAKLICVAVQASIQAMRQYGDRLQH